MPRVPSENTLSMYRTLKRSNLEHELKDMLLHISGVPDPTWNRWSGLTQAARFYVYEYLLKSRLRYEIGQNTPHMDYLRPVRDLGEDMSLDVDLWWAGKHDMSRCRVLDHDIINLDKAWLIINHGPKDYVIYQPPISEEEYEEFVAWRQENMILVDWTIGNAEVAGDDTEILPTGKDEPCYGPWSHTQSTASTKDESSEDGIASITTSEDYAINATDQAQISKLARNYPTALFAISMKRYSRKVVMKYSGWHIDDVGIPQKGLPGPYAQQVYHVRHLQLPDANPEHPVSFPQRTEEHFTQPIVRLPPANPEPVAPSVNRRVDPVTQAIERVNSSQRREAQFIQPREHPRSPRTDPEPAASSSHGSVERITQSVERASSPPREPPTRSVQLASARHIRVEQIVQAIERYKEKLGPKMMADQDRRLGSALRKVFGVVAENAPGHPSETDIVRDVREELELYGLLPVTDRDKENFIRGMFSRDAPALIRQTQLPFRPSPPERVEGTDAPRPTQPNPLARFEAIEQPSLPQQTYTFGTHSTLSSLEPKYHLPTYTPGMFGIGALAIAPQRTVDRGHARVQSEDSACSSHDGGRGRPNTNTQQTSSPRQRDLGRPMTNTQQTSSPRQRGRGRPKTNTQQTSSPRQRGSVYGMNDQVELSARGQHQYGTPSRSVRPAPGMGMQPGATAQQNGHMYGSHRQPQPHMSTYSLYQPQPREPSLVSGYDPYRHASQHSENSSTYLSHLTAQIQGIDQYGQLYGAYPSHANAQAGDSTQYGQFASMKQYGNLPYQPQNWHATNTGYGGDFLPSHNNQAPSFVTPPSGHRNPQVVSAQNVTQAPEQQGVYAPQPSRSPASFNPSAPAHTSPSKEYSPPSTAKSTPGPVSTNNDPPPTIKATLTPLPANNTPPDTRKPTPEPVATNNTLPVPWQTTRSPLPANDTLPATRKSTPEPVATSNSSSPPGSYAHTASSARVPLTPKVEEAQREKYDDEFPALGKVAVGRKTEASQYDDEFPVLGRNTAGGKKGSLREK